MAIIYSYPLNTPKRDDLLIGTVTYDEDAVNPVHGNPTVSFTVGSLLDLIASQGAAQNLQQVTNIGNTTTNSIVISNSLKVAGEYYDSSNQPGTAGQLLSSTATGTQWVNVAAQGVTSVGLSMPAAFTVTNSPITQSGTLTVTGAGTAAQYINGLGNLVTFPTIPTQYVLPVATTVALGGIKIGYTQNAKNYPIILSNEQAYVNVPWTDTPYTLPVATSTDLGGVKIGYTQTLKKYPVELLNEQMFVDVPWTDTPYTLPVATSTDLGGVKIGYTTDATARNYAVSLDTEQMLVNVPWTDTQNPFQTITGTGSDNTDSGVLLSNSGGTVLILGAGNITAAQSGNTITLTGTDADTGITGVTLATGTSTGSPLSESIANRELTLTSLEYDGGANIGYVPAGGTSTTYLKGDGSWAAIPTGLQFKGTWDASGGGGGSPDLTLAANKGAGFLWICDVAGTAYPNGGTNQPSTWALGDWAVYDGTAWTRVPATNAGVTSIVTTDGTYIDLTPNTATTGAITVTADLSAADGSSDTNTRFLSKDNTWDIPSYTGAGVTSLTSVKGTYIDITNNSTATGAVGLGTVDLNAVDGTSDTATKFLSKDNTWDVPSYTTDTNTIYDLENSSSGNTGDISLVTGDVVATADVNGASNTNSITYDNESPASGIVDGQIVRGTGVPAGTRVVSHTATVLTLNQIANVANNAVLSFHTADTVRLVGAGATVVDKNSGNIRITSTNTQNTYTAGAGLSVSNFVFSADIDTTAASSATNNLSTDSGRYYAVQLDNNATAADRKMVVNVPWSSGGTYSWTIKDNAANPGSSPVDSGETIQFVTATGTLGTALTEPSAGNFVMTLTSPDTDTTYSVFTGADGTNAGTLGLVPAPAAADNVKFLRGDATWASVPQGDITEIKVTAPITGAATSGIATIGIDTMGAATGSAAGTKGAVPASAAGDQAKFLRADATWVVPTNTWIANAVTVAGYVAAPATTDANLVWKTNASGEPAWRADATGDDTTYTIESGNTKVITLTGSDGNDSTVTFADGNDISISGNNDTITIASTFAEADTLATVTGRGATTTTKSYFNGDLEVNDTITVKRTGSNNGKISIEGNPPLLELKNYDGQTTSDQLLSSIEFYGSDTSGSNVAGVRASINCNTGFDDPTGTSNRNQGCLEFATYNGTDVSNSPLQRLKITPDGGFSFGNTSTAYGTSGQVLTSAGDAPPTWETPAADENFYLDGITKSGNELTFEVLGATDQSYTFGSNAFNSTTIPTDNNQLTNGAGYTTNTGTTTASNTQTFTNKSGNISQWTNDSGYITSYTESDTLATVTGRGATTATASTFSGGLTVNPASNNNPAITTNSALGSIISLGRNALPTNGNRLGKFEFNGYSSSGGNPVVSANIIATADANWVNSSNYGSEILFQTTVGVTLRSALTAKAGLLKVWGDGSADGKIILNCSQNSHGQTLSAQPHSEGITNTMLLPKGASSTLVSEATETVQSLTTTGTSGASTLSAAGVLNIPQYSDNNDVDYINAATFNTGNGILTGTGVGNAGFSVDLDGRYLTSYTETDTLATVTGRGATTGTACSFTNTTSFLIGGSGSANLYLGNIISPSSSDKGARFHSNNNDFYMDFQGDATQNWFLRDYDGLGGTHDRFGFNFINGTFTATGDVVAFGSPSDVRLKENIKPIESALDKVSKLQGVTFDWKNKSEDILNIKEDIGFIAQDVQKVLPELVRENDNGMLSMRHQGITPILLEAIKELKAEIEELKSNNCNCNK